MQNRDDSFYERAMQSVGHAEKMMDIRAENARNVLRAQAERRTRQVTQRQGTATENVQDDSGGHSDSVWESAKEAVHDAVEGAKEAVAELWEDIAYPEREDMGEDREQDGGDGEEDEEAGGNQ